MPSIIINIIGDIGLDITVVFLCKRIINLFSMKVVYKTVFIVGTLSVLLPAKVNAQQDVDDKANSPVSLSASYVGDLVSNFRGGIKKGTAYLGLLNVKADFYTSKWWKGGEAFINIGNTHGGEPTVDLIGDFQGVSNIEAGNLTFLYELWYKQCFGTACVTLGLQDLNAKFAVNDNGCLFTNSSFGIHSSIADNISSPIFPLTALGVNVQWDISNSFSCEAAIFDGTPDDFENNPYNVGWKLSKNQGFLAVTEFQLKKSLLRGMSGCYKFGAYYHQHNDTIEAIQKNGGFYFVVDQQITDKLFVFSQLGLSPEKINRNNYYVSLGFNCRGLMAKRPDDQFGIAVACAGFHNALVKHETVLELAYQFKVNKNIFIKPDIQYIINPAGTDVKLANALVGFIRFGVTI
ncbi:Carbohydrate-selective porin OprB [Paludibacter propionicigenes WB4]|uniref:Carbohydrate-selective porin OprB n=1 Tax=Paludibacter propionicigenes (strain DSM 17365 / JCM 13257 / WB4) TaxID=694427 RepID=E4T4G8_PALPW|nr:carbohydrate porin [Paludibacter propionicigenes]ADQ79612.1 Carbohydrate-selective porin OprB [Paludibacter propionicigenes WB4]